MNDQTFVLASVPIDGSSAPQIINGTLSFGCAVGSGFEISADGRSVFYIADQSFDGVIELYATFQARFLPHPGPTRTASRTQ